MCSCGIALRHPNHHPPNAPPMIMNNCCTAAHEDADKVLDRVRQELIVEKSMKAVLIVSTPTSQFALNGSVCAHETADEL